MFFKKSGYYSLVVEFFFYLVFYIYILRWVKPELVYFVQQPIFLTDISFITEHLKYPGGLATYISNFLSQFYSYPRAGALIITFITLCISVATNELLKRLDVRNFNLTLKLFPAIVLMFLHGNLQYLLTASIVLLISLIFILIYKQNTSRTLFLKSTLFISSSLILFYMCGGVSMLLYILICVFCELLYVKFSKKVSIILIIAVVLTTIPYILTRFFFYITYKKAYFHWFLKETYYKPDHWLFVLFMYFPLVLLGMAAFRYFSVKLAGNNKKVQKKGWRKINMAATMQTILIFLCLLVVAKFSIDEEQKHINEIKYQASQRDWEQVLRLAKEDPSIDRFVIFHTNRALYHTGRLCTDMFSYSQYWGKHALFLGEVVDPYALMDNSDLYFDLGHISAAKHWAYEAHTIYENSPRVLKQLAICNIILGNRDAANSILDVLKKSMIHKKWAAYYSKCNNNPSAFEKDSLLSEKRRILPKAQFYSDRTRLDYDLKIILEENNTNRMAFEYLMAYYLLSNDVIQFADNIKYMNVLGYKEIPVLFEEALVVYLRRKDAKRINLPGYSFRLATKQRYEDYARILISHNNDMVSAQRELYNYFGNSYWYYLHYTSPVTQKRELKFKPLK